MQKELEKLKSFVPFKFKGAYVAGGAITSIFTNQPIADIDVYFKTEVDFMRAVAQSHLDEGAFCLDISSRAATFSFGGTVVQLCRLDFFPTAHDIFKAFDFTVCMGAYDFDTDSFVLHEDFLKHNAQRFLKFNPATKYPIASALRLIKYQNKGYTVGKGEALKIVLACNKVPLNSWEDLEEQVGGAYGKKLLVDKEGKEFSIDLAMELLSEELKWEDVMGRWVPDFDYNFPYEESLLKRSGYSEERIKDFFDNEYNKEDSD